MNTVVKDNYRSFYQNELRTSGALPHGNFCPSVLSHWNFMDLKTNRHTSYSLSVEISFDFLELLYKKLSWIFRHFLQDYFSKETSFFCFITDFDKKFNFFICDFRKRDSGGWRAKEIGPRDLSRERRIKKSRVCRKSVSKNLKVIRV